MPDDIVIYDQNLNELCCPVLQVERPLVPFRVSIAKTCCEYENGCFYTLTIGMHFSLMRDGTIVIKEFPGEKIRRMLGLENRYIIVVENII